MPRIATLALEQVNKQFDLLDQLHKQVADLRAKLNNVGQSTNISDPIHAPQTTNNLIFTWTGGSQTLSWAQGFIKDKNWSSQNSFSTPAKSSAKGQSHIFTVPSGSLSLTPSTYYWLGWDSIHQSMQATTDASAIHNNYNVNIICQIFTGTAGQTGTAGGGGSNSGVDLSGHRYKNF